MATVMDAQTKPYTISSAPFPAASKSAAGTVDNNPTSCTLLSFTDKLILTVSQSGRNLSHWVHVSLATSPTDSGHVMLANEENALLPRADLTATSVLGGTREGEDVAGQTLATIIGSAILTKRPGEERLLVLGLGLQLENGMSGAAIDRQRFEEVVGLVLECL